MFEQPVVEWLESDCLPYLRRVARRVAFAHGISDTDGADLYQELCLALWKAGPDRRVNATWIFHTASHLAVDIFKRGRRAQRISAAVGAELTRFPASATREALLLIRARAGQLPRPLRRFYRLRFEEGYTQRELMQTAHMTRGGVREIERKCLRRLAGPRA
ncbi:MAG: sigma-70 family RNA polymerase sigma factor [Acidobacteriota bacterium]|nr:sigma-70 family RNA polymerase sigma factor [Acidobacteriota bacterium]